jgi:DNA-binding IclR family transcriptional regulator
MGMALFKARDDDDIAKIRAGVETMIEKIRRQNGDAQAGIETIETGMSLLNALGEFNNAQMLKTIAAAVGMPPSKAHRYLVSFIRTGFVDRDPETGRYRLGPASMQLGLSALGNTDAVYLATQALVDLRDKLDETTSLAVWGSHGATIVRIEEASRAVTINARPRTVLPLLGSSSGQVFAAFLPETMTGPMMRNEIRANHTRGDARLVRSQDDAKRLIADVRRRGLGRVTGEMMPGVHALAAPIFDYRGHAVVVVAAMGSSDTFDSRWNGEVAKVIRDIAHRVSTQLGYAPERLLARSPAVRRAASEKVAARNSENGADRKARRPQQ